MARLPELYFHRKPLPPPPLPEDYTSKLRRYYKQGQNIARNPSEPPSPLFKPGDDIIIGVMPVAAQHRFAPKWRGPCKVVSVLNRLQVVYNFHGKQCTAHVNHVKCYAEPLVSASTWYPTTK